MGNTINESAIKKLKLLFTVVERPKTEFYLDVLSEFEVNYQMVVGGKGTAASELLDMLGLNPHKGVILSVVREDMVDSIMKCLEGYRSMSAFLRTGRFIVPDKPCIFRGLCIFSGKIMYVQRKDGYRRLFCWMRKVGKLPNKR